MCDYDIPRCHHANIVDVMGFCVYPPIMYEYMDYALYDRLHKVCIKFHLLEDNRYGTCFHGTVLVTKGKNFQGCC